MTKKEKTDLYNQTQEIQKSPERKILYINDGEDLKHDERSINLVRFLMHHLLDDLHVKLIENIKMFYKSTSYWKEIQKRRLLKFLEFAIDETLVLTARSLLFAFKYSGTYEGIISLGQGIFGQGAIVVIESDEPAVFSLTISNANESFNLSMYAQENKTDYALYVPSKDVGDHVLDKPTNDYFTLAIADISEAISYNAYGFFKQFLTVGRVLKAINIDFSVKKDDKIEHGFRPNDDYFF